MQRWILGLSVTVLLTAAATPLRAGIIAVNSRAELGGDDFIDWGQLGPTGTEVLAPFRSTSSEPYTPFPPPTGLVATDDGMTVEASARALLPAISGTPTVDLTVDALHGFSSISMGPPNLGLFTTSSSGVTASLSVLLQFDQPIFGMGADISAFTGPVGLDGGPLQIIARDASFVFLGNVVVAAPSGFDGFLGLKTDSLTPDIAWVEIITSDVMRPTATPFTTRLEVNRIDLLTGASTVAVPEPMSIALFILGGASLALGRRRRFVAETQART
jgi:hypothetical protein